MELYFFPTSQEVVEQQGHTVSDFSCFRANTSAQWLMHPHFQSLIIFHGFESSALSLVSVSNNQWCNDPQLSFISISSRNIADISLAFHCYLSVNLFEWGSADTKLKTSDLAKPSV